MLLVTGGALVNTRVIESCLFPGINSVTERTLALIVRFRKVWDVAVLTCFETCVVEGICLPGSSIVAARAPAAIMFGR